MRTANTTLLFLLACAMIAACGKDEIIAVEGGSGGTSDIDPTDTVGLTADATVSVVFSTSGTATVSGLTDSVTATVIGNGVTIANAGTKVIAYNLSGTAADGYFKLYSPKKQVVNLNGVSITNSDGSAINIQSSKLTQMNVTGVNKLADGGTYSATPSTEDEKAALFSEGQMVIGGSGSLTVTATGKGGITSDDYLVFNSGTVKVTSTAGHGIRGKDYILVNGGTLDVSVSAAMKKGMSSDSLVRFDGGETTITVSGGTAYDSDDGEYTGSAGIKADQLFQMNAGTLAITNSGQGGKGISGDADGLFGGGTVSVTCTGNNYGSSGGSNPWGGGSGSDDGVAAKGIKFDGNLTFSGSAVSVSCSAHEGIEAKGTIAVTAGEVYSHSASDDAINAGGDLTIDGGYVCAHSAAGDGLDANGNCHLNGGLVYAIGGGGAEMAIDANSEAQKKLYVNGGTIIAIGGLENGASLSQSCHQASSWSQSTWYSLTVGDATYAFKTPTSGGSGLVVSGNSTPTLKSGVSVSGGTARFNGTLVEDASVSGGSEVTLSAYSGGGGNHGGGGGHGPGGH